MRYRYRSNALLGGWQSTAELACADAIRAGQARRDDDGAIIWMGNAWLEAAAPGEIARKVA